MPQAILVMEYADSCDTTYSSDNEITFDSSSWFLKQTIDNPVTGEFTLSRRHWFSPDEISCQTNPTSISPSDFSNLWIDTNPQRSWRKTRLPYEPFFIVEKLNAIWTSMQIPHQLAEIADESALNMLSAEDELVSHASQLLQSVLSEFSNLKLSAKCSLTTFTDPENEESSSLVLEAKIRDKPYSEILQIWDQLSMKLLSHLPIEVQKKVSIVLDEA